jgi:hypothetical protein
MTGLLKRLVAAVARRPVPVVVATILLTLAASLLALRLEPQTGTETLVGKGSDTYEATERYYEKFGDDAVIVLVEGPLTKTLLTEDLGKMLRLEHCVTGVVRQVDGQPWDGADGPCGDFLREKPTQATFGPGSFAFRAADQLRTEFARQQADVKRRSDRAARAVRELAKARGWSPERIRAAEKEAREAVEQKFLLDTARVALSYGLTSIPRPDDPRFVSRLVFDAAKPAGTPKTRFAYLFPTKNAALMQIRLKPDLSDRERAQFVDRLRTAIGRDTFRLENGTYTVTGAPVVLSELADEVTRSIGALLIAALLIMAATLALVFRVRMRMLPLAVALAAAGLTFGALSLAGAGLTMASIAVLPVLIGLAVDYAIQLQSRTLEEAEGDRAGPRGEGAARGPSIERAATRMAVTGAPTVATAAAATIAGFLVLLLSPVPMVRGFALLLVGGIVLALALALTAGTAGLVLASRRRRGPRPAAVEGARELVAPAARGASDLVAPVGRALGRFATGVSGRAIAIAQRRPERVLAAAAVLALAGWGLDTQTRVESDVQKLVPQDLRALRDLGELQRATGVGGQLDVLVESDDVATAEVVRWMTSYQRRVLERYRYSSDRGCGRAELCPAFSLPDLFRREVREDRQVDALLDAVPPDFSQAVITGNRRAATLSFGIRLMPLEKQKEVIDTMRAELDPPEGVRAELAGLPVLAAEAHASVASDSRRLLTLVAGLVAVFLVLLVALRHWRRAAVPLVPIVLATGWSSLVLFALRIPLNPMSVTLGALVIAISTEFSVLLSERYRQERRAGHEPAEALARTYRSTGAAVLASGVTAIAGFAVLVVSDIRMLRDFGFVTVVDLAVSLVGVLVVLPSVLLLAERGVSVPRVRLPRVRLRRAPAA